jgi:hypothetical protein
VRPVSRAYLMTRGFPRRLDYRFLGALPPAQWWAPLRDRELVNLEQPEVIAYGGGTSLSVLLSGIPSGRRDVVGTPIRYLVVVDDLREGETDALLARRLVLAGLRDEDRQAFGRALDAAFDEATVDAMLSGTRDTAPVGDVVAEVLAKSWGAGDAGQPAGGPPRPAADAGSSWAGPADQEQARRDFLARVAALAGGGQGFAFTSHSLVTKAGVTSALAELRGSNVVLLTDGELTEVMRLGKAVATVPRRRGELTHRSAQQLTHRSPQQLTQWIPQQLTRPVVLAGAGGVTLIAIAVVLLVLLL